MIRFLKEQRKNLTKQVSELTERLEAHDNRLTTASNAAERIRDAFAPQAKLVRYIVVLHAIVFFSPQV